MKDFTTIDNFKNDCYALAEYYQHACILDSCDLTSGAFEGRYELLAAFGATELITTLDQLDQATKHQHWVFGAISYDLKNEFEELSSSNSSFIHQEDIALFVPEVVVGVTRDGEVLPLKGQLPTEQELVSSSYACEGLTKVNSINKDYYVQHINAIKELILDGVVYELNYCVQHQYTYDTFNPMAYHQKLIKQSPVPMASYLKWDEKHLCGASMERYLAKKDGRLFSQPIKGTIRKGKDEEEDKQLMIALFQSEKERAENVMIVDLVRNDLAKICKAGTIKVDELFGIYSYLQLHQMISTVSGACAESSFSELLKASFPMGSMTGAPKISAMEQIEELEDFKRGWYAGCVGYIQPNGDFDFNVVIRSLICDEKEKKIAYSAGGAITIDSVPESEWHECLLKTKAIEHVLLD